MAHCHRLVVGGRAAVLVPEGELPPLVVVLSSNSVSFYLLGEDLLRLLDVRIGLENGRLVLHVLILLIHENLIVFFFVFI